jgi:hypothetical protein
VPGGQPPAKLSIAVTLSIPSASDSAKADLSMIASFECHGLGNPSLCPPIAYVNSHNPIVVFPNIPA